MIAAKTANLKNGEQVRRVAKKNAALSEDVAQKPVSNVMAAEVLDVSASSVSRANAVQESGDQNLIEAVERGKEPSAPSCGDTQVGLETPTSCQPCAGQRRTPVPLRGRSYPEFLTHNVRVRKVPLASS